MVSPNPPPEPPAPVSARVRRSWARMGYDMVWAAVIVAASAAPALLLPSWLTRIVSGLFVLGVGVTTFIVAFTGSGVAGCPGCGARVWSLSPSRDNVGSQCGRCLQFVESAGGELRLTPEDRVARASVFGVDVGMGAVELPELCAACGAPATRRLTLPRRKERPALEVPHCSAHEHGARLSAHGNRDVLYARSLGFARAAAARHGGALLGKDHRAEGDVAATWELGLGLGIMAFGFALYLLLGWAEEADASINGRTSMVILYLLLGKVALGGLFMSIGSMLVLHFVMSRGEALRRRLGLG